MSTNVNRSHMSKELHGRLIAVKPSPYYLATRDTVAKTPSCQRLAHHIVESLSHCCFEEFGAHLLPYHQEDLV